MKRAGGAEDAVSEVVGEMILIAIVLILVSLVGISIYGLVPGEREPSVDVLFENTGGSVALHHKGGDAIPKGDLLLFIEGDRFTHAEFAMYDQNDNELSDPDALFDLGCRIEMSGLDLTGGERVQLATPRAVIFSGVTK
ncbi:MAG: type IV pilin N-terminal domain-containing protein [Methanomicrobiales archaeon]|nr:type IV pilin N-terminal domain-containing protein [Methanomicrobiales archaeon]